MNEVKNYDVLTDNFLESYFKSIKGSKKLLTDFGCFDIETTNEVYADYIGMTLPVWYSWQFQLGDTTIIGRSLNTFVEFIERIKPFIDDKQYNVYVHNLVFEGSFLINCLPVTKRFPSSGNKLIYLVSDNIKFLCSYQLSGVGLEGFTEGCENAKFVEGEYDYEKLRLPWTYLTDDEMTYIINDVAGLREAIQRLMKIKGYDLSRLEKIMTQNGFAKYLMKEAYKKETTLREESMKEVIEEYRTKRWHAKPDEVVPQNYIYTNNANTEYGKVNHPSYRAHQVLQHATQGAIVWAVDKYRSAFYDNDTKDVMLKNVWLYDIKKCYTSCMIGDKYPVGKWDEFKKATIDNLRALWMQKAWTGVIKFKNIRLKNENEPVPAIVKHCTIIDKTINPEWSCDIRLLKADELELATLDVDFHYIDEQYEWDEAIVVECHVSDYGYLPTWIRNSIKNHYFKLAKLDKQSAEYRTEKTILQCFYGSFVRDKCKEIEEDGIVRPMTEKEYKDALKYHIFNYAWGVWTAAWGRSKIYELIKIAGDKTIYLGSDSIKTLGPVDFSEFNYIASQKAYGCATKEELMSSDYNTIGCILHENTAKRFKTLKQIVYCCEYDKSWDELAEEKFLPKISQKDRNWAIETLGFTDEDFANFNVVITVGGLNKVRGSMELYKKGGIDAFKRGLIFDKTDRLLPKYINLPYCTIKYDSQDLAVCGGVSLRRHHLFILGEENLVNTEIVEFEASIKEVLENVRRQKLFF